MKTFQIPILSTRGMAMSLLGLCLLSGLDAPPARADFTFGAPTNLGPTVNSSAEDITATISPDGLELYFGSTRSGGYGSCDLWVTKRASVGDPWGPPSNLGPEINTAGWDLVGNISADGLTLYFDSGGPYGRAYKTTRTTREAPWGPRVDLGPIINGAPGPGHPVISADDLELYFICTGLPGYGGWDIWVSTRTSNSDSWGTPVNLGPAVNTPANEAALWISPDGLTLLISSDRPGGFGNLDVWMTTRPYKGGAWGPPRNLGPSVNTSYADWITAISPDGRMCYINDYLGPRPGGHGGSDLWQAPIIRFVDFNGDGKIDGKDVLCMVSHWGTDDPLCDIGPFAWGDGTVGLEDLTVLAEYLGKEVTDPALIARWTLDETEGSAAHESVSGGADVVLGGLWQPTGGQVAGAIQLDGSDDCVVATFALNPAKGPFSVLAWVKGGASGQVVISEPTAANWLVADAEGKLMTELKGSGRSDGPLLSQTIITDGQWHRIALVWDGSNRMLYIDGVVAAEDTQSTLPKSGNGLYIGTGKGMEPGTFWSGLIDDLRIYNRAVSP